MAIVTSGDVHEIVSRLSSDKAKAREEGIKLLNTWLEGERSIGFCRFLAQNTAKLKADELPNAETWPFLVKLLIQCVSLEVSGSKRRIPKLFFAKTLRIVVQRAEDTKLPGVMLPLLSVLKTLFSHLCEVLSNVPSFHSEYGIILRHLLAVRQYRFLMKKRIYARFLLLYLEKVKLSLSEKGNIQMSQKDEGFRSILTLRSLLENPPGDFPDYLREDTVKGFIQIFTSLRDEGKLSRKLIECVNMFLLKDGPNLGSRSLELHNAIQEFIFHCWSKSHDRGLKDALVFYARLQLNLARTSAEASSILEQLVDLVFKELDLSSSCGSGVAWGDSTRDDRFGMLSSSQIGLVELAAFFIYRACVCTSRSLTTEKRARRLPAASRLKEALTEGKWMWYAAFYYLIRDYHTRLSKDVLLYWFEAIHMSFERVLNDANARHAYDCLLWTLRSLQELSWALLLSDNAMGISSKASCSAGQLDPGWQLIWSHLMHGLVMFSGVNIIADAALVVLGCICSSDRVKISFVPQDVWDHHLFKQKSSESVLYFIACYFSRIGCQGDIRDELHLRKSLLRALLRSLNWKGSLQLNERTVLLLPAAVFALCAGCAPFLQSFNRNSLSHSLSDVTEVANYGIEIDELEFEKAKPVECSAEVLTRILPIPIKASVLQLHQNVRLPRQLRDPLMEDLEFCILRYLQEEDGEKKPLSEVFSACALLCYILYASSLTRCGEQDSSFRSKISLQLLDMVNYADKLVQESLSDLLSLNYLSASSNVNEKSSVVLSLRCFVCSPIFKKRRQEICLDAEVYDAIIQSLEKLPKSFAKVYEEYTVYTQNMQSLVIPSDWSMLGSSMKVSSSAEGSRIMDLELDVDEDIKDVNIVAASGKTATGIPTSTTYWKLQMISLISCFFSVTHVRTWEVLFTLLEKESDQKVYEIMVYNLCQHPHYLPSEKMLDLVKMMNELIKVHVKLKLDSLNIVAALHCLLGALLSLELDFGQGRSNNIALREELDQVFLLVGDMLNNVADFLDWFGRIKLIDCIHDFLLLNPQMGQTVVERLLKILSDPDYRVRLFLARRIGVLFQTWDGHEDLFQDICLNFGVLLVTFSKEKLVTAKDVLAVGSQPRPTMETVIVTLMHVAFHSEKIEMQAVFVMCAICAIDPCQRELVAAALESVSRQLQYSSGLKYMEELMGSILFCWVTCGVSLAALVETRQSFGSDAEPKHFIQFCCQRLLPALLLNDDAANLNWVAKMVGQQLAVLIREHFVSIFSICMALYSSKKPGSEKGAKVLESSILCLGEMSEEERDKLIKNNMVSIVSHMLSLASCTSEPVIPSFSKEVVAHAVQTVVDGQDDPRGIGVVDKIKIFRPDRVFMFIVEIHYRITAASHERHKCHHLAAVEVLLSVIGHRAAVASTFNYLLNIAGQYIGCYGLQGQCCHMISHLLDTFKSNPSEETTRVLGEQLQFLVSKLVACYNPSQPDSEASDSRSSQVLSLLHQLTIGSDPSLYDYVKELEPFPEISIFNDLRDFHLQLCQTYSPRDHLLKFVKRSFYLPPRLLCQSLQALHKKLVTMEASQREKNVETAEDAYWHSDSEVLRAIWTLVCMSSSDDANSIRPLVSDFVSRAGIGDPHCVVFRLPGEFSRMHIFQSVNRDVGTEIRLSMDNGVSDGILVALLKILKKYLMDDSVKIVDIASQTLKAILSTERGQRALSSFDSYEQSLIEVHSKGINFDLVEKVLLALEQKFKAEDVSTEKSIVWSTQNKSFETWICQLVYSLTGYCDDVIIRLCQDIVSVKAEVAELLLPSVFVSLAGNKDKCFDLHKLISTQVQEHIFTGSNKLMKSVQVLLNALNELRICYVMERATSSESTKQENSKNFRPPTYSSRARSAPAKAKNAAAIPNATASSLSPFMWDKVYWLSIDYLLVAKAAVACGAHFTSFMYVEHWCEEHFKGLTLGSPDFSHLDELPPHIDILVSAIKRINEPDSLYGVIQSNKHEGNWSKALEYYDLKVRSDSIIKSNGLSRTLTVGTCQSSSLSSPFIPEEGAMHRKPYKGLIRSLQQIGCMHVVNTYCQGLTSQESQFQHDPEFIELQFEAAWRAADWDFSLLYPETNSSPPLQLIQNCNFNESLHSCLRALQEGDSTNFHGTLEKTKQELLWSISCASEESTELIFSTVIKLQILYHLGIGWDIRWTKSLDERAKFCQEKQKKNTNNVVPTMQQLLWLNKDWSSILRRAQLHMNLLEPFIAFRRVFLQVLGCEDYMMQHLLQSASTLRKGCRFSQAAASLHEFKFSCVGTEGQYSDLYWLGRLEEAKLLRAQGQHEIAINLANYVLENYHLNEASPDVYRLVGKWLAEMRSSNSRIILEKYLKPAAALAEKQSSTCKKSITRQNQTWYHLARYADALFRSYEERLSSNEWQAAMRLRKHKTKELEALTKRFKSSTKGDKTDYSMKIQELQKQLAMDREEAKKLQDDRDAFLNLALDGYKRCLLIGDKYDVRVVFRLVSVWFSLSTRENVVNNMLHMIDEVQSYKFIPLVYQIASRMGSSKEVSGSHSFQFSLASLVKKMAIDHPYHTIFQLLALANGDRIKDKQRSRNSFVVDVDKKLAAEKLLLEVSEYHGPIIGQMKQMVEIYIRLAELETRREDTNKRISLPREIRSVRQLELVPVVTATFPIDRSCQYSEGSFPYFRRLSDSIMVMNGINAPKVVECFGSDGHRYRQLAKSGNDDLRQDAVMEQFFGLVNTFLNNNRDTWKRRLGIRTYKVVPFTPSAGVLEWVDGTIPLGDYLIGSTRNGGCHSRYGIGDWPYPKCREHMSNEKDKRKAFQEVCENFSPVMHYFFLEKFLQPADWFEKRLAYTRSVAASSMVGYIVGLGDRHAMNILIDQATAEVVHIDLGVAFEQGLMLKTPERVPFRLTRDIIDGMGVTGVEGVFRRCCEETLSVMRTNKEALLTIVEVFIHDPLYKWALSPLKALERQKETDDDEDTGVEGLQEEFEGNKDATRALMRVKQKLDGYEDGEMRSIHGQVQQLIQDAVDPERLCQMFPGWGAWM